MAYDTEQLITGQMEIEGKQDRKRGLGVNQVYVIWN